MLSPHLPPTPTLVREFILRICRYLYNWKALFARGKAGFARFRVQTRDSTQNGLSCLHQKPETGPSWCPPTQSVQNAHGSTASALRTIHDLRRYFICLKWKAIFFRLNLRRVGWPNVITVWPGVIARTALKGSDLPNRRSSRTDRVFGPRPGGTAAGTINTRLFVNPGVQARAFSL
jgi:hypothetical protein